MWICEGVLWTGEWFEGIVGRVGGVGRHLGELVLSQR